MKKYLFCLLSIFCSISTYGQRIQPNDLDYLGAFRLPDVAGDVTWEFSGTAMTCDPNGDAQGPDDGFPGSLFIVGHDWYQYVAEVAIPQPVISATKNVDDLNTATMLQPFGDIKAGMFGELEMPTVGLTLLPDATGATRGDLYFCWGQHFQFHEPTHGFCGLDLSAPHSSGPFYFGTANNYSTCDYMFTLPDAWAQAHTHGQNLACGRFREGQWSGFGPALYAFSPFLQGDIPAAGDTIKALTPLLLYGQDDPTLPEVIVDESIKMDAYSPADQWSGATWISAGDNAAVIFSGTKAMGHNWYGFGNGVVWPDEPPYPEVPGPPFDDRGWWCDSVRAQIIFYDPADLAAVAEGRLQPWEPQPYATLDINDVLFDPGFDFPRYKRWSLGAVCFDREHDHLFITERRADEDKSLVHVWQVRDNSTKVEIEPDAVPDAFSLGQNYPNPFNPTTTIACDLPQDAFVELTVLDVLGREIKRLVHERKSAGRYSFKWDGKDDHGAAATSGVYFYRIKIKTAQKTMTKTDKMMLVR